jgi:hypothetical protein
MRSVFLTPFAVDAVKRLRLHPESLQRNLSVTTLTGSMRDMRHSLQGSVDLAQFGIAAIFKNLVECLFLYIGCLVQRIGRQDGVTQPLRPIQCLKKENPSPTEQVLT